MAITRINEFRAGAGKAAELSAELAAIVPSIAAAPGCLSCRLLRSQKDADHFIVLEEWDSVQAHRDSLMRGAPDAFHDVKKLLATPPTGEYYDA
jgi:quinol monooxygenase YgiN